MTVYSQFCDDTLQLVPLPDPRQVPDGVTTGSSPA